MPGMSDDEAFGSPAASAAPAQGGGMSDEEAFGTPKSAAPSPASSQVPSIVKDTILPSLARNDSPMSTVYQTAGAAAGAGLNEVGKAVQAIPGYDTIVNKPMQSIRDMGTMMESAMPPGYFAAKKGVAQESSDLAAAHPEAAANLNAAMNLNMAAPMLEGVTRLGSGVERIKPADMAAEQRGQNTRFINGINDNLDAMRGTKDEETGRTVGGYGDIYNKAGEISNGVTVSASKAKGNVQSLVDDLANDPAHKTEQGSSQAYRDLDAVAKSFDENGNIPLDSVSLLKKRLNDLYSPDMGEARGKIYNSLNNQVNNIIRQARGENPEWATLMDSGNGLFMNYKKTTDSLSNAWSVADKKEYQDAMKAKESDPTAAPPTQDVRQKISNIAAPKNIQQYEDTLRVLPSELHDEYTKAVLDNNPKNSRLWRGIKASYDAVTGMPWRAKNDLYEAVMGNAEKKIDPSLAQSFPHVEDAIDYHTNNASDAYGKYMDNQYSAQNPKPLLALPAPATRLPAEQSGLYKALPAPDPLDSRFPRVNEPGRVFGQDASGTVRPMTQQELERHIANEQSKSPDITTAERAAQQDRATTQESNRLKKAWDEYVKNPLAQSDLSAESADMPLLPTKEYARGGTVNRNPSEAQIGKRYLVKIPRIGEKYATLQGFTKQKNPRAILLLDNKNKLTPPADKVQFYEIAS